MTIKIAARNLLLLLASLHALPVLSASSRYLRQNGNGNKAKNYVDCTLLIKETKYDDGESQDLECETEEGEVLPFENIPSGLKDKFEAGLIESNFDKLRVVGNGNMKIKNRKFVINNGAVMSVIKRDKSKKDKRDLQAVTPRRTLAIWISAPDANTTTPMDDGNANCLTDNIFGTYGDVNNLRTKYLECSYGQTEFEAFDGPTSSSADVVNGVFAVSIAQTVTGVDDGIVREAATAAAQTALGPLSSQFDHVIFCLPPGTAGGWIGYAYINNWRSVYNDQWCNYVSIQMHELGHNLGLAHSGETAEYDDQSGMMGFSYGSDDTPNMCFNAAKSWQLGWYSASRETLSPGPYGWSGKIYGIDDYQSPISSDGKILIRLASTSSDDIYVSFNKANGINSGTQEGRDQVLVHKRSGTSITDFTKSTLLAKLGVGQTYTATINGESVPIVVNALTTGSSGFAEVQIGVVTSAPSSSPTNPPTLVPTTNAPTKAPSAAPTQSPTQAPTTSAPTKAPSDAPTQSPTQAPTTTAPTKAPSAAPTQSPTQAPTTTAPTKAPSEAPTQSPTQAPTTSAPTKAPSEAPTQSPNQAPTTSAPTQAPSAAPTQSPTQAPTTSAPTKAPSAAPTESPTQAPTTSAPTKAPSEAPTQSPTQAPTSSAPTKAPSAAPTESPTQAPSAAPTQSPTETPTSTPTQSPVDVPTAAPVNPPTNSPTNTPTASPTSFPTEAPTFVPTADPKCSSLKKPWKCRRNSACYWKNGRCQVKSAGNKCSKYLNGGACKRNGCKWKNETCVKP